MASDRNRNIDRVEAVEPPEEKRRAWVSPEISRIRAGDAEVGDNPIAVEGAFASGS